MLTSLQRYEEAIWAKKKCLALDSTDEMAAAALEICKTMTAQESEKSAQ